MGQVSGVYYEGADIMMFDASGSSSQSGSEGAVSGSGSWTYTILYTDKGFTDTSWFAAGKEWNEAELLALSTKDQYRIATALNGNYATWSCVDLTEN